MVLNNRYPVKKMIGLTVETLILVAVWDNPFIFQGCITVTAHHNNKKVTLFFRCQSRHTEQMNILHYDFLPDDYEFTHLYNELGFIPSEINDPVKDYALDMMKYALHVTLKEMISNRKIHFTSIDDIAMQAMINTIKPILNKGITAPDNEHIGFAVAMDFSPQEEMGYLAIDRLLNQLKTHSQSH